MPTIPNSSPFHSTSCDYQTDYNFETIKTEVRKALNVMNEQTMTQSIDAKP